MKATIYYIDNITNGIRRKTIRTNETEPNAIVIDFIEKTKQHKNTVVTKIKIDRRSYIWNGTCNEAF